MSFLASLLSRPTRFLAAATLAGFASWLPGAAAFAQTWPGAQWARAKDLHAQGWSAAKLDAAEAHTRAALKSDAWMLVHRGVVIRQFGDVAKVSNIASARKSVMSLLVGIEHDRGRFPLDRTLADLGIDDKQGLTPMEKTATIRHLLQGRSGIYHPAAYESPAMKVGRPARGAFAPGENFNYNNWDFNALGTVHRQIAGRTAFEALRDELAVPLRFQDFQLPTAGHYETESSSVHPAYVMRLSARDMARIGLLVARGGQWQDKQLVSPAWIRESTTAHSNIRPGSGYGYMWWVGFSEPLGSRLKFPRPAIIAAGNLGQYIVIDPARDIVFVHKVDFEAVPGREVTPAQFANLLARIFDAFTPP